MLSAPMYALQSAGIISPRTSVLDYGCGKGDDVCALTQAGFNAIGWDPHFAPNPDALAEADVVNLGFVLNVIEDEAERLNALQTAFSYARSCLAVAVMLVGRGSLNHVRPYKDGFLTSRNTFQKYYSQSELRDFITSSLEIAPVAAGPGIFFVFKDQTAEQRFLFRRQIGVRHTTALINGLEKTERFVPPSELSKDDRNISRDIKELVTELGRAPHESEVPKRIATRIAGSKRSLSYFVNQAAAKFAPGELEFIAETKIDELKLFFALNAFSKRPPYNELAPELQRDVKAFFGSHQRATTEGQALLFSIGDAEQLFKDVEVAITEGIGRLVDDKFQFHKVDLPNLSIRLRGFVAIAELLAGDLSGAPILRIHIESKKLTALYYDDFDSSALPKLSKRTKVDFRSFDVVPVDHIAREEVKLLFLRSEYLRTEHPHFERQKHFDEQVQMLDGLEFDLEGPDLKSFTQSLISANIRIPKFE